MKRPAVTMVLAAICLSLAYGQPARPFKVLISVDMEGISGIVASE